VISLIRFFNKFKFIFFYYYQKLNKNIYKFSNYKRPRYSLKFNYLPPFKRARVMLKFLQKSLIYSNQRTFTNRFIDMFWNFYLKRDCLFFIFYTQQLQLRLFKKQKSLFLLA